MENNKPILKIKNLSKKMGWNLILDNINLEIEENQIMALVWPNWAWKSSLIRTICWLLRIDSWEIEFFGEKWKLDHLKMVGALIEKPNLYEHLSWIDNLRIYALITNTNKTRIREVLAIVWLDSKASKKLTKQYSLGMKQRLAIAITLLHNPKFLIFDEPTNGLDIEWIRDIRELIIELWRVWWFTIILCSHNLEGIKKVCTNICLINKWKIKYSWKMSDFMSKWKDIEEIYLSVSNWN